MSNLSVFLNEKSMEVDTTDHTPVVIAPGRINPPHRGHLQMIKKLVALGKKLKAEPVVIIIDSGKYSEKNPLTGEVRLQYLKIMFPNVGVRFIIAQNPYAAIALLADPEDSSSKKYVPVGGVTGSDRADSYKTMVTRMFGDEVGEKYQAVVLQRDPDAEGKIAGISATKVRDAAKDNDLVKFRTMTGLDANNGKKLMNLVRKGMGIK